MNSIPVLTVTELTSEISFQFSNHFSRVFVCGEISGISRPKSGHFYFILKDPQAQIRAVVWKSDAERIFQAQPFELADGLSVICGGGISVYAGRGEYQINVRSIMPFGEGPLELALRQLRERLEKEGLFNSARKRSLPRFPRRVAVITSPTGAAIKDFLHVLRSRWNGLEVTILPVKVQGAGAARQITYALNAIARFNVPPDVVVLTRGGGSIEDLWCFNEEQVCRAIFNCPVPVVCGVGHETDVTLSDFVADVRALTPSEAALKIVPDRREVQRHLNELKNRLVGRLEAKYQQSIQAIEGLMNRPVLRQPMDRFHNLEMELDRLSSNLDRAIQDQVRRHHQDLQALAGRLTTINPATVLARGYSLTSDESGKLVFDSDKIAVGSLLNTRLFNGSLTSRVEVVNPE